MSSHDHAWSADLIAPDHDFAGAPLLRKEFSLDDGHGAVESATLFVTAHGVVEPSINGLPVSDEVLTPGWSSYEWRLRYRTHDVTALLGDTSVLGLALGNGWFRGRLGWSGESAFYGGPVWQAHRNEANATMVDSDNVLLLHAPNAAH